MNLFEKKITENARKRLEKEFENALKLLSGNEILRRLKIGNFNLRSEHGYCPATDLFITSDIESQILLKKETNFDAACKEVLEKYKEEEQKKILEKIDILKDYLND